MNKNMNNKKYGKKTFSNISSKIGHRLPSSLPRIYRQLFEGAAAFIPRHVNSKLLLGSLEFLRSLHRRFGKKNYERILDNEKVISSSHMDSIRENKGFIEDQFRYHDVPLGAVNMAYAGCEIIALYNAIHACLLRTGVHAFGDAEATYIPYTKASRPVSPAKALSTMIAAFEKDGILLSGRFGTSPKALCDYLNRIGIKAVLTHLKSDSFTTGEDLPTASDSKLEGDCFILTYYNNGSDITDQVHTICITKNDRGDLIGHNVTGGRATMPCKSVTEMLRKAHQDNAVGIALITICFPL